MLETETKYILKILADLFRDHPLCDRGLTMRMYLLAANTIPLILFNEHNSPRQGNELDAPLDIDELGRIGEYLFKPLEAVYNEEFPVVQTISGFNM